MKVTSDTSWANYMEVVCNPAAMIYARPMVYVQFVESMRTSGVGGSSEATGEEEPVLVSGVGGDTREEVGDGDLRRRADNFEPNEGVERWWVARIDCHEYLTDQVEEVESEEEDVETISSEDEEDREAATGGAAGGVVTTNIAYVPSRLDDVATTSLVLPQLKWAVWGFNEDTLLLGQRFPNKSATQHAIARYAINIGRTYQVQRSNPDTYIVRCVDESCASKVRAQWFMVVVTSFQITVLKDHTCELAEPLHRHRNMTSSYVASLISHLVAGDVSISPKLLLANVANMVGSQASYKTA